MRKHSIAERIRRRRRKEEGSTDDSWIDSVLGSSKEGVFTADFDETNGTTVEVRDGESTMLNCRVYLRHDKTVRGEEKCF
jgi:hypothetical protein